MLLVHAKADVNIKNSYKESPMTLAINAYKYRSHLVERLLETDFIDFSQKHENGHALLELAKIKVDQNLNDTDVKSMFFKLKKRALKDESDEKDKKYEALITSAKSLDVPLSFDIANLLVKFIPSEIPGLEELDT